MSTYKEYKVMIVAEGAIGTLFLGASGMPLKRLESVLNEEAADGWQLVFTPLFIIGIILIAGITIVELWALFRAQVIAQDFNNQLALRILNELGKD